MNEIRRSRARATIYVSFAVILGIIAVLVCAFWEKYAKDIVNSTIEFDHDSGFYSDEFDVELSVGKDYFLTYTLDGTNPSVDSARYEGPIHIYDASGNENVFSLDKYTCALYFDKSTDFSVPNKKIDKCTLLRVSAFDANGNKVSSDAREYFVGFDDKTGYDGLYTVCISTDPENLFHETTGIYVLGKHIQDRIDSGELDGYDWKDDWDLQRQSNWFLAGMDSERVAMLELFDGDKEKVLTTNCGIRVRGHGSRNWPQKSLGLYARKEYNSARIDKFEYDFFGDGIYPHKIILSDGGDDCNIKLTDYLIYSILGKKNNAFSIFELLPCSLFLNGEYWGPMYVVRDLDNDYIANEYGLTSDNIRLLKAGVMKGDDQVVDKASDDDEWENLVRFILENDMSISENYANVCSQMDIESFAEYAATEVYIGNIDWHPNANFACWRTSKFEKGNPYSDGKWRFCLYDVNWSLISQSDVWEYQEGDDSYEIVKKLGDNEEFELLFKKKIDELEDSFSEENVQRTVAEWQMIMGEPTRKYYERFAHEANADREIEKKIDCVVGFCKNRPNEMEELYNYFFE